MRALLFPLAIAMVITLAFGFFSNGLQFTDLLMIGFAILTVMAANLVKYYEHKHQVNLQTVKLTIKKS